MGWIIIANFESENHEKNKGESKKWQLLSSITDYICKGRVT